MNLVKWPGLSQVGLEWGKGPMQHLPCPLVSPSSMWVWSPSRVLVHTLMVAEPTVSDGAEQVSVFNQNVQIWRNWAGLPCFALSFFVCQCPGGD